MSLPRHPKTSIHRGENNQLLTSGLFVETAMSFDTVRFTLSREDHPDYPSLYRLYMLEVDPTEYTFATKYFESFTHWEKVAKLAAVAREVSDWRREMEIKVRALGLSRLIAEASSEGKSSAAAAKFLVEKGWVDKQSKGRPSKEEIKKAARDIADADKQTSEDASRILPFIKVV
jgi:hypothetical protein